MRTRSYRLGDRLRPLAIFSGCSALELAAADPLFTQVSLSEGYELIRRGDVGSELFVIEDGKAVVSATDEVACVGVGDCVGEVALMFGSRRNADVRATTPVTALVVGPREFKSLLRAVPTVADRLRATAEARR